MLLLNVKTVVTTYFSSLNEEHPKSVFLFRIGWCVSLELLQASALLTKSVPHTRIPLAECIASKQLSF
jgi:hypothetical protein